MAEKMYRCPKCKGIFKGVHNRCPRCGVKFAPPVRKVNQQVNYGAYNGTSTNSTNQNINQQHPQPTNKAHIPSTFDGHSLIRLLVLLLCGFVSFITIGIMSGWAICFFQRWQASHTKIDGKQVVFNGKAIPLLRKLIIWFLLCIITLGIYSIFFSYNLDKWIIEHTGFEGESDPSVFSGNRYEYFGLMFLNFGLTAATLGIYSPVARTNYLDWKYNNSTYSGKTLEFHNNKYEYIGRNVLWAIFTVISLGIYGIFVPVRQLRWELARTNIKY